MQYDSHVWAHFAANMGLPSPDRPLFDDDLKLAVAKLVCCGAHGCMSMIQNRADDPARCWCEINDFNGSHTEQTAEKIIELFKGRTS